VVNARAVQSKFISFTLEEMQIEVINKLRELVLSNVFVRLRF
jgi:hypothetical protein